MRRTTRKDARWLGVLLMMAFLPACEKWATAGIVDFEDLPLSSDSYWNGSPTNGTNTFNSGAFKFYNYFDNSSWGVDVWSGFAYSNKKDTTTPGATNQFSAIPGSGADGSSNYAVAYWPLWGGVIPRIDVPDNVSLISAQVTNTTYAYLSMRNGDSFAKKFGGPTGDDPDWFKLIIYGKDLQGEVIGTIEFYLADFRFDDNRFDYILGTWATVVLTPIASARILEFALDSSDKGDWGMNTPAYFALDNIVFQAAGEGSQVVPEPSSAFLVLSGLVSGGCLRRKRKLKVAAV